MIVIADASQWHRDISSDDLGGLGEMASLATEFVDVCRHGRRLPQSDQGGHAEDDDA